MSSDLSLDPKTTAVLFMDFQHGTLSRVGEQGPPLVARAARVLERARACGSLTIFIRVAFRPGYPEVSERNLGFAAVRKSGLFLIDGQDTQIVNELAPQAHEPIVVKHRVGPFAGTDLEPILRARPVETLVLLGISTSGVVLSSVRHAADHDYRLVVASDGCADPDPEVHRVLMEKVFPRQATVVTSEALLAALG